MSKTISVRIEHAKKDRTNSQRRHDLRTGRQPSYVNTSKSDENSVIIEPLQASHMREVCEERRGKTAKIGMKADPNLSINGIITFGTEAQPIIESLTKPQQNAVFVKVANRIADELGTTVSGLVVHRDESAIHAHFQLPEYRLDGNQVARNCTVSVLKRLQDIAGEEVSHLGITRGESKVDRIKRGDDQSKIVHRSVKQLHADLPAEIEAAEERARIEIEKTEAKIRDAQEKLEKYTDLAEKAEKRLADGIGDAEKVEKRLEKYQNRIAKAKEILEKHPTPSSKKVDIVKKTKRFGGLLPDKIEIEQKVVVEKEQLTRWVHSYAEEQARKDRKLANQEAEIKKRESALEQRLATVKSESEQLAALRSELHDLGRDLADDPQTLARFHGLIADEIKAGVEQVHFERAESKQEAVERAESQNQDRDEGMSL